MTLTFDTRTRMLLLILLLVCAGAVVGLMAFERLHASNDGSSAPTPATTHTPRHTATKPAATPSTVSKPAHTSTHRPRPAATRPKPAAAVPPNQLPFAIRRALAGGQVVVVALYDPKATIDGTALDEARAGARLAGSSFVPIDVRRHGVDSLNARYGAIQDPAVLVLRPPDSLVVRIDGFADRDTVAQAAANAAS